MRWKWIVYHLCIGIMKIPMNSSAFLLFHRATIPSSSSSRRRDSTSHQFKCVSIETKIMCCDESEIDGFHSLVDGYTADSASICTCKKYRYNLIRNCFDCYWWEIMFSDAFFDRKTFPYQHFLIQFRCFAAIDELGFSTEITRLELHCIYLVF